MFREWERYKTYKYKTDVEGIYFSMYYRYNETCIKRTPSGNGLLHLKSIPPGWGLTFSSYPLRMAKIAFTPEDFHKIWAYPRRIGSYPWRILWKLRLHPQRIPYFFTLPLKKSSIFITYPRELHGSSTGGVRILNNAIAQCCSVHLIN